MLLVYSDSATEALGNYGPKGNLQC